MPPARAAESAATGSFTSASSSQNTSNRSAVQPRTIDSNFTGSATSAMLRMPHCSAASIAFARMRARLTRSGWVWRVSTGQSREAPISTAFCTM